MMSEPMLLARRFTSLSRRRRYAGARTSAKILPNWPRLERFGFLPPFLMAEISVPPPLVAYFGRRSAMRPRHAAIWSPATA